MNKPSKLQEIVEDWIAPLAFLALIVGGFLWLINLK